MAQPIPFAQPEWTDFIGDFLSLTEGRLSPRLFRHWSAIALVAGALERRVWLKVGPYIVYPNLYTLLVGPPGSGKSVIELVRKLWTETCEPGTKARVFHVAPDQMTTAAMIDSLALARSIKLPPKGEPHQYHSLLVAAEEMSNFMPIYDRSFISTFVTMWGNKDLHHEVRRHGHARDVQIENPQFNLFGGAQPAWLADTFPDNVWETGIGRRMIMIYSNEKPLVDVFALPHMNEGLKKTILQKLGLISQLAGQFQLEPEAQTRLSEWHLSGGPPIPTHSKLVPYNQTRTEFIEKLSMVSAVSRTNRLVIGLADANRAIEWLTDAERVMPDIFRAMIGRSDKQVLEELQLFVLGMWNKNKKAPIPGHRIIAFLAERLPSDKVERLFAIADRGGYIARIAGMDDMWSPTGKEGERVE